MIRLATVARRWRVTRRWQVIAVASLLVLTVAAVAVFSTRTGRHAAGQPQPRVATIGVIAALSGDTASDGRAVRNAVQLAVDQATANGELPGWRIAVRAEDDSSTPDGGAQAASDLVSDDTVLGVVGPLSSTVATVAVPLLSTAGIPVVSPSNSLASLTGLGSLPRTRPYRAYFRLSATDTAQASAAADWAVRTMGRGRIAVVEGPAGVVPSVGTDFATAAGRLGATITSFQEVGSATDGADPGVVAARVLSGRPDLVYVATSASFAVSLRKSLAAAGSAVTVMGSDSLFTPRYTDGAGTLADGDVVTDLAAPLSRMPGGTAFTAAYADRSNAASPSASPPAATAGPSGSPTPSPSPSVTPPPSVAAYAYDAAVALLRAAPAALAGRARVDPQARSALVAGVARSSFEGVTGHIAFDRWGDPIASDITIYDISGEQFVPVRVISRG